MRMFRQMNHPSCTEVRCNIHNITNLDIVPFLHPKSLIIHRPESQTSEMSAPEPSPEPDVLKEKQ